MAVALSGGRDSLALLHATARCATHLGLQVHALHVHHGLMPEADAWADQLEQTCRRWARKGWPLQFSMQRLQTGPAPGDSVEAWARRERYRALGTLARQAGASLVLLAHHRRDQAETFLLQALRGAGPAGLAAMPRSAQRDGITWARPWLDLPREAIEAYVRQHRIRFVDDASNADARYARNRLRLQVMPALRQAFPQAEAALAEAAQRAAEAQAALEELADADLPTLRDGAALRVGAWAALPAARRRNALRAWLRGCLGRGAPNSLVERLMAELPLPGPAHWLAEGATLRRYRGRLSADTSALVSPTPTAPQALSLATAGTYALPAWGGSLQLRSTPTGGVALSRLGACELRVRAGSERFQLHAGGPPRSLKKAFQTAGVPAWQRSAPLLYGADGRLLFVPGLGIDARALAGPGEPQVLLEWCPSQ